jgi:hypothetical protein
MPTKKTDTGRSYKVDGKTFTWTSDEGNEVVLPMRLKLRVIRQLAGRDMDAAVMFDILEAIAPGQAEAFDDMDVNDFQAMFATWQEEYNALTGATLGE